MEGFYIQDIRMSGQEPDVFVAKVWTDSDVIQDYVYTATMGKTDLDVQVIPRMGVDVRKKYMRLDKIINVEYYLYVTLPKEYSDMDELVLWVDESGHRKIFSIPARKIRLLENRIDSRIENIYRHPDQRFCLDGWCVSARPVVFRLQDSRGNVLEAEVRHHVRGDIFDEYPEIPADTYCGFNVIFDGNTTGKVTLILDDGKHKQNFTVKPAEYVNNFNGMASTNRMKRAVSFLRQRGMKETWNKGMEVLMKRKKATYKYWREQHMATPEELEAQRKTRFAQMPKFSLVVPLYRSNPTYLKELIRSMQNQTYGNWELCLSDGSGADSPIWSQVEKWTGEDKRIRGVRCENPCRIAENTNQALQMVTGDYIGFVDHDDLLAPDALFECAKHIDANPQTAVLYTDEDKVDGKGKDYFMPHFKSDYNPDMLCSVNYISHLFVVKASLQKEVGLLNPDFDGAQDYDFIFRCVEAVQPEQICHIPKALYHWRTHQESTAQNPESKQYAFEAGRRAIEEHYKRVGIRATVEGTSIPGIYRTHYILEETPLISIIIPNKDHTEDLDKCIRSIEENSHYLNKEYIIVENNSEQERTFQYYKELEQANPRVKIVYYEGGFNYSAINNFGVRHAAGEYLLLLNNDTEIINEDCLEEMLGYCMREDVGIVGARLFFEDDTIQHAGVIIGFGGLAGHAFAQASKDDPGYFGRIWCAQDLSAVTAACLMTKRSVFEQVGGLSEDLVVAFNDIDYCLKVRQTGRLVVYNPYAMLHHYESKSRGYENTPEKVARFNREIVLLDQKWPDIMKNGDPYYNVNLALNKTDFSLRVDK